MRTGRVALAQGLLPLLDISLMLLGLMIVVTVAKADREASQRSVWAGMSVVLLELGHEDDEFRVYAVDPVTGRRHGGGHELAEAGRLVDEILTREKRAAAAAGKVLVLLQGRDLLAAPAWRVEHTATLRDALAEHRWNIVWGR